MGRRLAVVFLVTLTAGCSSAMQGRPPGGTEASEAFARALENGRLANEAFERSDRLMDAWLERADPRTGLLPRNLGQGRDFWNAQDAAADLYPFLVLTASFTDPGLYRGRLTELLLTETALTSRIDRLPDAYSFSKHAFLEPEPDLDRVMFGASEYVKDGLMPITEWLGETPWKARMLGILDDVWANAPISTPYGRIPSTDREVNGEMLQVLARVYWMTGEQKYLDYALRLGDYYLLGDHHPTDDFETIRLRDHGNEVISGLTELYAAVHTARPEKAAAYREPIHRMLDRVLEVGRTPDGLFYDVIDPRAGKVVAERIADNFGYILNGFYTVYLLDGAERYRDATRQALGVLRDGYAEFDWEGGSADGDADAIEGALNLYNRERVPSAAEWIDLQTRYMWSKQDSAHRADTEQFRGTGIVEGWHGDGNFARTSLMYALWKTQGTHVQPWREDVVFGAERVGDEVYVTLTADAPWSGRLIFDSPRHRTVLGLPFDWPRINQFPEWFTVDAQADYRVIDVDSGAERRVRGAELLEGWKIQLAPGEVARLVVERS